MYYRPNADFDTVTDLAAKFSFSFMTIVSAESIVIPNSLRTVLNKTKIGICRLFKTFLPRMKSESMFILKLLEVKVILPD